MHDEFLRESAWKASQAVVIITPDCKHKLPHINEAISNVSTISIVSQPLSVLKICPK